jgi:hypothetical protein
LAELEALAWSSIATMFPLSIRMDRPDTNFTVGPVLI